MRKLGFVIAATVAFAQAASADAVKKDIYACTNEHSVSEMIGYQNGKDRNGIKALIEAKNCIYIDQGEQISILRPGVLMATIRYKGQAWFTTADALR